MPLPGVIAASHSGFDPSIWSHYWEADTGVTTVAGNVSQWVDQVASATFVQTTASARPIYESSYAAANGQPVLRGDGTRYMTDGSQGVRTSLEISVVVADVTDEFLLRTRFSGAGYMVDINGDQLRWYVRTDEGDAQFASKVPASLEDGGVHVIRCTYDESTGTSALILDGTEIASSTNAAMAGDTITDEVPLVLMAAGSSGGQEFIGSVAAVGIRNRLLTSNERSAWNQHTQDIWGVAA